jgi:Holliday junction resolvase-like predicted endonuclease
VRRLRNAASAWMQDQPNEWWDESCFWLVVTQPNGQCEWQLDPF